MTFLVEDGTGLANANAYATLDETIAYAADRGLTFAASPSTTGEQAIVRGSAAIDATYRGRFPGYKSTREQGMEWPRTGAYDGTGYLVSLVPIEVKRAAMEAAIREYASAGSMMPDLERGGAISAIRAGSVAIEYAGNAETRTVYTLIDGLLSGLLVVGSGGGLFGYAVRG